MARCMHRDKRVWRFAVEEARAPVVQLLSGGYTRASAGVIVDALEAVLTLYAGLGGGGSSCGSGAGKGHGSGG